VGGSKAGKPWTLKSGGLEPSSLIEVYAYDEHGTLFKWLQVKFLYYTSCDISMLIVYINGNI